MSGFIEGESRSQATLFPGRIYGYLNHIQSSRRLEREAGRNVELTRGR